MGSSFKIFSGVFLGVLLSSGCASKPDNLVAAHVSPLKYSQYSCEQVLQEMEYTSQRTIELYNSLNKKADTDSAQMAVGMLLFWPALFFLEGGDGPEASEYSRLKGEYEALRKISIQKKCENAASIVPFDQLIKKDSTIEDNNTSNTN